MRLEHASEQLLVGAEAVEGRGVEEIDAGIERREEYTLGHVGRRRRAVGVAQVHASLADRRDAEGSDRPQTPAPASWASSRSMVR